MIVHALRLRGLTRFADELAIDFDDAPGILLAVEGPNGAGKTTVLEAVIVAIFGTFPTRPGSIYDYCQGRDAFVELDATLGADRWRFLRRIDAERRTQEVQIWINGEARTEGKVGEADALVAAGWPPLGQILATTFAAQGGAGSFLTLPPAERKDLVVRMLGLDRLQALSDLAAAELTERRSAVAVARGRHDDALERAAQLVTAGEEADRLEVAAAAAEEAHAAARAAAQSAERAASAAQSAAKLANDKRDDLGVQIAEAVDASRAAGAAVLEVEGRHAAAARAAEEVAELRARVVDVGPLRVARDAARVAADAAEEAFRAGHDAEREAGRARPPLVRRLEDLDRQLARLPDAEEVAARRADADAERVALDALERLTSEADAAAAEASRLARAAEEERKARRELTTAEERAALVDRVPCGGRVLLAPDDDPILTTAEDVDCSACPLLVDAVAARGNLDELRDDLDFVDGAEADAARASMTAREATTARDDARRRAEGLRGASARLEAVERDAARRDELVAARDQARAELDAAEARYGVAARALEPLIPARVQARQVLEDAERAVTAAEEARDRLAELADQAAKLDALAGDLARLTTERDDKIKICQVTRAAFDAAKADAEPHRAAVARAGTDLAHAGQEERAAKRVAEEARRAAERARGRALALGELEGRARAAAEDLATAEQAAKDAEVLADALGRNGVQAMELDAAGPAVSELATEIARTVYGPRFAVLFVTQVLKKGQAGKRGETREAFEVQVLDADRGTAGPAERLSGGEQVVISEAIRLALAVFAAQSATTPIRTLIRDESDGALDAERAVHYPAMLRRAADLGGFARVLLVSHRPDNVAACDGVLRVFDGTATLEVA